MEERNSIWNIWKLIWINDKKKVKLERGEPTCWVWVDIDEGDESDSKNKELINWIINK